MFRDASGFKKIYIATGRTDLRKGIEGLAAIIKLQFHLEPRDRNTLFLFCGTRNDRIKGLLWEGLSAGFCYPHIFSEEPVNSIICSINSSKNVRIKIS